MPFDPRRHRILDDVPGLRISPGKLPMIGGQRIMIGRHDGRALNASVDLTAGVDEANSKAGFRTFHTL
jgi:hypothetical protein